MLVEESHPELFHYTGADGLLGIITSGCLRSTHYAFLNDDQEYRLFHERVLPEIVRRGAEKALAGLAPDDRARVLKEFAGEDHLISEFTERLHGTLAENVRAFGTPYVTSFCTPLDEHVRKHGLLSQWRAYGKKGGYAIVFDTAQLSALLKLEGALRKVQVFLGGVEYYDGKPDFRGQQSDTKAQMDVIETSIADFMLTGGAESLEPVLAPALMLGALIKDEGFSEEREVRLVTCEPSDAIQGALPEEFPNPKKVRHIVRNGALAPFLTLLEEVGEGRARLPIKRIIVGPHREAELRRQGTESLLRAHGYLAEVELSGIPFRG